MTCREIWDILSHLSHAWCGQDHWGYGCRALSQLHSSPEARLVLLGGLKIKWRCEINHCLEGPAHDKCFLYLGWCRQPRATSLLWRTGVQTSSSSATALMQLPFGHVQSLLCDPETSAGCFSTPSCLTSTPQDISFKITCHLSSAVWQWVFVVWLFWWRITDVWYLYFFSPGYCFKWGWDRNKLKYLE